MTTDGAANPVPKGHCPRIHRAVAVSAPKEEATSLVICDA